MSGAEQLKAALLKKQTGNPPPLKPKAWTGEIKYITEGTHIASDGKEYTYVRDLVSGSDNPPSNGS